MFRHPLAADALCREIEIKRLDLEKNFSTAVRILVGTNFTKYSFFSLFADMRVDIY